MASHLIELQLERSFSIRRGVAAHPSGGYGPSLRRGPQFACLFLSVSELNLRLKIKKLTRCSFLHESHVVAIRGWPHLLRLSGEGRALSGSVTWDGYDETGRDGQVESVSPAYVTISNRTSGPLAKLDQIKCCLLLGFIENLLFIRPDHFRASQRCRFGVLKPNAGLCSRYTEAPTPTPRFLKFRLLHKSSICINNGKPIRHFITTTWIIRLLSWLITCI
jgi:hypothetical protein